MHVHIIERCIAYPVIHADEVKTVTSAMESSPSGYDELPVTIPS